MSGRTIAPAIRLLIFRFILFDYSINLLKTGYEHSSNINSMIRRQHLHHLLWAGIGSLIIYASCKDKSSPAVEWKQVWDDEFNYTGLPDSTRWNYDTGGHGWGNNELQFYTLKRLENARVENGYLTIEARREPWQKMNYTSARLVSKGKGDWHEGKI